MNVFGRPHWRISQHFPITLTFIAGTNYRSTWHPLHTPTQTEITFSVVLSQYILHLCHRKPKGNEHKLLLSCWCEIEEGMLMWWMSLLRTELAGKTDMFMLQIFNDCCSTPENGSKMHYWTHLTKLNQKPPQYPSELSTLFPDWITAHATTFHFTHLMCADRKLAHLNQKMEENYAHLLNLAPLNHHLLSEIAP